MNDRLKNIIITVCFLGTLYGIMLINIMKPDALVSYSERRTLAKVPDYSGEKLLKGELFADYEKYFLDQFVFRDGFRGLKAFTRFHIFRQKDNNGIYLLDGSIHKLEYPLNEKAILYAAEKFNEVYDKYLQGMEVSYAIIPDKNYYTASENGYPAMDYDRLLQLMEQNIRHMAYIDLFSALEPEDYHRTDIHWRQDRIVDIAELLIREMGGDIPAPEAAYEEKSLYPFYGSYYGQAALKLKPDSLVYLSNDALDNAIVYDHIDKTYSKVYQLNKFGSIDSYDVFLSGAKSILTITNPGAATDEELVIFRDSFGSSIAPLMLKAYAKITLIDLRYLKTDILGEYMEFTGNQQVLFLYNTVILNNSYMLK